jgi:hypothetical protein
LLEASGSAVGIVLPPTRPMLLGHFRCPDMAIGKTRHGMAIGKWMCLKMRDTFYISIFHRKNMKKCENEASNFGLVYFQTTPMVKR